MSQNHKVVFAAADTFRAAAIEQMEVHAKKLGVHLIKREYGADPTAVAYDAVSYSKAHGIDVVLIDTAGRQDTNVNLINELKKMNRIINPNFRIYIGESIAGNAIIEQVSTFNQEIGIDGVILTKLDCDAKGGSVLSISKTTILSKTFFDAKLSDIKSSSPRIAMFPLVRQTVEIYSTLRFMLSFATVNWQSFGFAINLALLKSDTALLLAGNSIFFFMVMPFILTMPLFFSSSSIIMAIGIGYPVS